MWLLHALQVLGCLLLLRKASAQDGTRKPLVIGTCLRAADYNMVYTCTLFRASYTLYVRKYDASDTTCQTALGPVAKMKHEALCAADIKSKGGFRMVHCGDDGVALAGVQMSPALVVPQLFQEQACVTAARAQQERHVFGACTASDYRFKGWWSAKSRFHYVLTLVQSMPQIRLRMQTYQASDTTCKQRSTAVKDILYAPVPTDPALVRCLPDPLFVGYYYINSLAAAPFFFFVGQPSPIPSPTPSAEPTTVPSAAATTSPSPLPSSIPTAYPTALPSTQPSASPTPLPSPMPSSVPSVAPTAIPTE